MGLQAKKGLESHSSGDVSVEVNSNAGPDLKKQLDDLRVEYEHIIENNRREVEDWYENKVSYCGNELRVSKATGFYFGNHDNFKR